MQERTFAMIKPEGLRDKKVLIEIIIQIYEHGLKISAKDFRHPDEALIQEHYCDHLKEEHYPKLVDQLVRSQVLAMVLEGEDAVSVWRQLMGPFKEERLLPEFKDTIRGKYMDKGAPSNYNYCHGADSVAAAEREIALWFPNLAS